MVVIDLNDSDMTGVEVKLRQGASISGVVVIEGTSAPDILSKLSQVNLLAFVKSVSPTLVILPRAAKVLADGSFRVIGLPPGKAVIWVNLSPDVRGLSVSRIEYNGAADDEIEVGVGDHLTGVRVVLGYSAYKLRGQLKIIGGAPPAGARFRAIAVKVSNPMQSTPAADVDDQGQFVFEYMAPGEYEIRVFPIFAPDGERGDLQTIQLISSFKARAVVTGASSEPVILVVDLGRKEENQ